MIIVAGTFTIDLAEIERVREVGTAMMAASNAEEGCVAYTFAQSLVDPATVNVFELWKSKAALDEHFATPHMVVFLEALGSLNILGREIAVYEAEQTGTL